MKQERLSFLKEAYAEQPAGLDLIRKLEDVDGKGSFLSGPIQLVYVALELNARLGPLPEMDAQIEEDCRRVYNAILMVEASLRTLLEASTSPKVVH